jgi:hypothetical protein
MHDRTDFQALDGSHSAEMLQGSTPSRVNFANFFSNMWNLP